MFLTPIAADRPIRIVDTLIGYTLSNPCSQTWLVASTPAARWHFSTLTESTPLDQYQKNWYRWLHRRLLRLCQIWCKSVHGGLLGNWDLGFLFIYVFIPFSGTHLQVRPVEGFLRLMVQSTRTCASLCLLGFRWYWSSLSRWNPPKLNFGSWIGVFKPNWQNLESYILSQLLHRFQPSIAQRSRPPSGHRGWSQYVHNKSKMADGRHFEKSVKSQCLCNRLTDFDEIWHGDEY